MRICVPKSLVFVYCFLCSTTHSFASRPTSSIVALAVCAAADRSPLPRRVQVDDIHEKQLVLPCSSGLNRPWR